MSRSLLLAMTCLFLGSCGGDDAASDSSGGGTGGGEGPTVAGLLCEGPNCPADLGCPDTEPEYATSCDTPGMLCSYCREQDGFIITLWCSDGDGMPGEEWNLSNEPTSCN